MDSVLNQDYENFEYILIDGNSKDGTQELIAKAKERFSEKIQYVSERDEGIYDAMNKGIARARGDVIGFLNADDVFENTKVLSDYAITFAATHADIVFADLKYVDRNDLNRIRRYWKSGSLPKNKMLGGWHPAHPTFYARRELYEKHGFFRKDLRIAADYEIMLRFLEKYKASCAYLPQSVVRMREGGESNRSFANILKANKECYLSWKLNSLSMSPLTIPLKLLWKLSQIVIPSLVEGSQSARKDEAQRKG